DVLGLLVAHGEAEVLLQLARHDLDGPLAGHLPGGLAAHPVGHQADGHVGELLDVDGVFVVLAVVAQQRALADTQRQGHVATSSFPGLGRRAEAGREAPRPPPSWPAATAAFPERTRVSLPGQVRRAVLARREVPPPPGSILTCGTALTSFPRRKVMRHLTGTTPQTSTTQPPPPPPTPPPLPP